MVAKLFLLYVEKTTDRQTDRHPSLLLCWWWFWNSLKHGQNPNRCFGFWPSASRFRKKTKTKNQQQLISLYLNVFLDFFSLLRLLLLLSSQHFPRLHRDALKLFLAVIFGSAPLIGAVLKPVSATFSSTLLSRTFGATGGKQTRINECRAWVEKKKSATRVYERLSLLWAVAPYVLQWAACTLS